MRLALVLSVLLLLAACGQKGPLYRPEPPAEESSEETRDGRGASR